VAFGQAGKAVDQAGAVRAAQLGDCRHQHDGEDQQGKQEPEMGGVEFVPA
jgi:hypothetical protein